MWVGLGELCRIFFFKDTATTEIYTLSLHDALPISVAVLVHAYVPASASGHAATAPGAEPTISARGELRPDRKSTRLNSSHANISYAVFCLKNKNRNCQHIAHPHDSAGIRRHLLVHL